MSRSYDVLIVGAGPAGMSAAVRARALGLTVLVVDDQHAPGGQIWRAVETVAATATGTLLGEEYQSGAKLAQQFRASGAELATQTQVWQIEPGWNVYMSRDQQAEMVQARQVLLASGAQERPMPFPGWTLPGVMTVGAAQILLKTSRQIPADPVWVAGSGPLPLLYMTQLLRAGGKIAGWLDTSPPGAWRRALPHLTRAAGGWRDIAKGLGWLRALRRAGFPIVRNVTQLRALGGDRVESIEYRTADGKFASAPARLLLAHEGVVPSVHFTQALECQHAWLQAQACLAPVVDEWGQTNRPSLYVAGDGVGIGGARAACTRGEIAALGMALHAGKLDKQNARQQAAPLRARLAVELSARPLLDAVYPPRAEIFAPADDTIVCRCEELTAGDIRAFSNVGQPGPNQIKAFTRAGMGPCQGRQCGYTIAHILASDQHRPVQQVGFYRIRPPLKPLTLGELASLDMSEPVVRGAKEGL
jgi:NADPH-dependent 2,4-dienoyl-CoA reductase/sulfur reductase-like enzyme